MEEEHMEDDVVEEEGTRDAAASDGEREPQSQVPQDDALIEVAVGEAGGKEEIAVEGSDTTPPCEPSAEPTFTTPERPTAEERSLVAPPRAPSSRLTTPPRLRKPPPHSRSASYHTTDRSRPVTSQSSGSRRSMSSAALRQLALYEPKAHPNDFLLPYPSELASKLYVAHPNQVSPVRLQSILPAMYGDSAAEQGASGAVARPPRTVPLGTPDKSTRVPTKVQALSCKLDTFSPENVPKLSKFTTSQDSKHSERWMNTIKNSRSSMKEQALADSVAKAKQEAAKAAKQAAFQRAKLTGTTDWKGEGWRWYRDKSRRWAASQLERENRLYRLLRPLPTKQVELDNNKPSNTEVPRVVLPSRPSTTPQGSLNPSKAKRKKSEKRRISITEQLAQVADSVHRRMSQGAQTSPSGPGGTTDPADAHDIQAGTLPMLSGGAPGAAETEQRDAPAAHRSKLQAPVDTAPDDKERRGTKFSQQIGPPTSWGFEGPEGMFSEGATDGEGRLIAETPDEDQLKKMVLTDTTSVNPPSELVTPQSGQEGTALLPSLGCAVSDEERSRCVSAPIWSPSTETHERLLTGTSGPRLPSSHKSRQLAALKEKESFERILEKMYPGPHVWRTDQQHQAWLAMRAKRKHVNAHAQKLRSTYKEFQGVIDIIQRRQFMANYNGGKLGKHITAPEEHGSRKQKRMQQQQ